jgi:hypothetical protein
MAHPIRRLVVHDERWQRSQNLIERPQIVCQPTERVASDDDIHGQGPIHRQRPNAGSLQGAQMTPDSQCGPDIGAERTDVGSLRAGHTKADVTPFDREYFQCMNRHRPGFSDNRLAGTGRLV